MPLSDLDAFLAKLEKLGEETVQKNLNRHVYGVPTNLADPKISVVVGWLKAKAEARVDAREQEAIDIAREANDIARSARQWAKYAAIAAVIALIISLVQGKS